MRTVTLGRTGLVVSAAGLGTGGGNVEHLKANVAAINAPKLPDEILEQLDALFGKVDCIAGN